MIARVAGRCAAPVVIAAAAATLMGLSFEQPAAVAQTGQFLAVLNEQNMNGDSRRSVEYFDANDLGAGPMFSVFMGYEEGTDYEEPNIIDVDPTTGDVYVMSFDSGTAGQPNGDGRDSIGDLDLYRIDFSNVFNHWATNFRGKNVRTLGAPFNVGGPVPGGSKNSLNLDYVTYGDDLTPLLFNFDVFHSNTFVLPGVIDKLGEVKRNNGGNFFPFSLEFIDEETLFLLDDSSELQANDNAAFDHEYRILEQASTSPGAANDAMLDNLDGGFNRGTSQSWNSRRIGLVNLDFVGGTPTGHSEVESTAYYRDTVSGVRGVWVTESDGGGDDVAFLQLDASNNAIGYRQLSTGSTSFALDNDPFTSTATNDGKADNVFVDLDTGDLIVMESGFGDLAAGIGPEHEPAVLRLDVVNYDNGSGQIELGAWSQKVVLNPTKTPGDVGFLERGQWTAWDSENDRVFIVNPGAAGETPPFEMDIWVIDMKVGSPTFGQTMSFLDLDESVSLFTGDSFGDKVAFWSLAAAEDADFDGDLDIDGNDFLIWQRGLGTTGTGTNLTGDANNDTNVDAADLAIWKAQYGLPLPASAAVGAVPEPGAVALMICAVLCGVGLRRRA